MTTAIPGLDRDAWLAESLQHFKALLRIDTTNPPGNESAAAHFLAQLLAREGIEHVIVEKRPGRSNLIARLRGNGNAPPLLLNGHLDVVPAERARWRFDPFAATEADGCIWGRGAIDMKNMVAMSLMTLIALKRSGLPLQRDVIFAAVADEEAGSDAGSVFLVEEYPELVRAAYVLNEVGGQTTHIGAQRFYPIQVAEKGICWFELEAHGDPGHGSLPHGNNAVAKLAAAVQRLATLRLPQHVVPEVEAFLGAIAARAGLVQGGILRGLLAPSLAEFMLGLIRARNSDQATAFDAMLRNTVTPTMLDAGSKINVIPGSARARFDGRVLPGWSREQFLAEVRALIGDELTLTVLSEHDGVRFPADTPLFDCLTQTLARFDPGSIALPYMTPGFTDSFAYARLGAVCYGFNPVRLGPELNFSKMFHGHDERIPVDGYLWGQRALLHAVAGFCAVAAPAWLDTLAAGN